MFFIVSCSNKIDKNLENGQRITPPYNYILMKNVKQTGNYVIMDDDFANIYEKTMKETNDMEPKYAKDIILMQKK